MRRATDRHIIETDRVLSHHVNVFSCFQINAVESIYHIYMLLIDHPYRGRKSIIISYLFQKDSDYSVGTLTCEKPSCYSQVVKHKRRHCAINDKYNVLISNETWQL